jgi:L-alanine-DL-glutamate epimerase-like enolase superfamily enzyme
VLHAASLHLAANITNLFILETVRRHYSDEYQGIVTNTYPARGGQMPIPEGPGLGVELTSETLQREDATVHRIE